MDNNGRACDCVPLGTLIYGQNVPIPINEVGSEVWTVNGRVRSVSQKMKRVFEGQLSKIEIEYTNIPLVISQEHQVYGSWNSRKANWRCNGGGIEQSTLHWISAGELNDKSFIAFPRVKEIHDMGIITPAFAELLGWYVAEGNKSESDVHRTIRPLCRDA